MPAETIKMSSRGQIVIPQDIREELKASEGTIFQLFPPRIQLYWKDY